jgi:hypothetical protein
VIELFAMLIFTHALADYPLQGDFLARGKNRTAPIQGIPWQHPLAAHSVIHGGFVGLITGSVWLGAAETVAHAIIDDAKCRGKIGYHADQALHVACKAIWIALLFWSTTQ